MLKQFRSSTNWQKLFTAIAERFDNQLDVIESLRDYRGLETAEGVWLDIIGDILGCPRPNAEQPYSTIFAFKDAEEDLDDSFKGFILDSPS